MNTKTNIWQQLDTPIMALAPMENVTDTVFRQIVISCGRPDIMFTEFTNVQGMLSEGAEHVVHRLQFTETERPIIAQIWGITPENYYEAAQHIATLGFDGIDINMGCPAKKIVKKGCCSALINNHPLAKEIIQATKDGSSGLPVSVKTRIGFDKIVTEEWVTFLLEQQIDALTIHGRTTKEMSDVPNHWEEVAKVPQLRDTISPKTIIIGNGDVKSLEDAHSMINQYKLDGIMIGRGIFDNPWFFNPEVDPDQITAKQRLELFDQHIKLFKQTWSDEKYFALLKKFIKMYVVGFPGCAQERKLLFDAESLNVLHQRVQILLENLPIEA